MKHRVSALALALIAAGAAAAGSKKSPAAVTPCGVSCLSAAMDDFLSKTFSRRTGEINLAPGALVYFNTNAGKLDGNPLVRARTVKSKQVFTDPETGNVVARTGLEMEDGRVAYASTRLKVAGGKITQVEVSFDDSPRVAASYVTFLDPIMTTIVPESERLPRAQLKAIVERYFQALTDHRPVAADYDERCDRYHSGQRVTNNPRNTVEAGNGGGCYQSVAGNRPWGPATDIHIPLADPEHGIAVGYTLLLYQDGTPPMYVSEVFKILKGKIRQIDNIGLKAAGMKPVNFPE